MDDFPFSSTCSHYVECWTASHWWDCPHIATGFGRWWYICNSPWWSEADFKVFFSSLFLVLVGVYWAHVYRGPCVVIIYTHPSRVGGIEQLFSPSVLISLVKPDVLLELDTNIELVIWFYSVRTAAVLPHILPKLVQPPLSWVGLWYYILFSLWITPFYLQIALLVQFIQCTCIGCTSRGCWTRFEFTYWNCPPSIDSCYGWWRCGEMHSKQNHLLSRHLTSLFI